MKVGRWVAGLLWALVASFALAQQQTGFQQLDVSDGLSQNSVNALLQDRHGFLWIATQDGLNRYDGYSFRVYRPGPIQTEKGLVSQPGPSANVIWSLHEDSDGVLWMGTAGGLDRYQHDSDSFVHYRHDPDREDSISASAVTGILDDEDGRLWVATERGGLNLMDRDTGTFRHFQHEPGNPESLSSNNIASLAQTDDGTLWIGTRDAGLNRMDPRTGTVTRIQDGSATDQVLFSDDVIMELLVTRDNMLWVATNGGGLARVDPDTGDVRRYRHDLQDPAGIASDAVRTLYEDREGRLWIGHAHGGGLDRLDRQSDTFTTYTPEPGRNGTLSGGDVQALLEDDSGILWVGTLVGGLNSHDPRRYRFQHYRNEPYRDNSLNNNTIRAFHRIDSRLYVGTEGGLNVLDLETGDFSHHVHDPESSGGLPHDIIRDIDSDGRGGLWLATHNGLVYYDPAAEDFTVFRHDPEDPDSIADNTVFRVVVDSDGMVWAGTLNALNRLNPETGEVRRFVHDPDDPDSLPGDRVLTVYEDRTGDIWAGTMSTGVSRYDRERDRFIQYTHEPDDPASLSNSYVFSILEDDSGTMWFGTRGGISRLDDRQSGRFTRYTAQDGLPNNVVYGILQDNQGHLWFSTNSGIARMNPEGGEIVSFDGSDGLQADEFNNGAYYRAGSGEMYFGGINGFNVFDPARIEASDFQPQVHVTGFQVQNEARSVGVPYSGEAPIELLHDENQLAFEFAALDFSAPDNNRYAYRLVGFDDDWVEAGSRRFVSYTNISPGSYRFEMRGSNSDGRWSRHTATLPLEIRPAFWQTVWFRIIVVAAVVLALVLLYWYKAARMRQRNAELSRLVGERTAALQQSNENLQAEIRQRKRAEEEIRKIAYYDYLTGLPNRRLFMSLCEKAVMRSERSGANLAMLFVDMDHFKSINDRWGHEAGDGVLVETARRISEELRGSDIACRMGGDEFILLLDNLKEPADARIVAEKLLEAIRMPITITSSGGEPHPVTVGISIGISLYPGDASSVEQLMAHADEAMYRAKREEQPACYMYGE